MTDPRSLPEYDSQDECRWLKEGESFDDLQRGGLKIIQSSSVFKFGMDAVLLSDFAKASKDEKVLDLCSGNGIVPLLLATRDKGAHITGIELSRYSAEMAARSVAYNGLKDRITMICGDALKAKELLGGGLCDVITCNPPYMKGGHGLKNTDDAKTIARHEIKLTLEELVAQMAKLLRTKGRVYMVHRPFRLGELFVVMHEYGIELKRMRMVHPFADHEPNMVLLEGVRGAKSYLKVDPPLIVYDSPGNYTTEIMNIYGYSENP